MRWPLDRCRRRLAWACLLIAGCATASTTERVQLYNDDGVYLFAQGQYRPALECFELALTLHPDDDALLFNAGQCHDRLGHAQTAEKYYVECLQRSARHVEARQAYVALLSRTGRADQANQLIDDWLTQQPDVADGYALDAWRLRQQNAIPQAQARLQQALARDPHHSRALTELALLYEQTGMPDRAYVLYERILARDPRQHEVAQRLEQLKEKGVKRPLPEQ
ncbi:MAG: tetratricopeptide repeat protein [Gemmataceae bacterium]|nr:tetratricopeptide repeat protein [Gemmataceae bacterium]